MRESRPGLRLRRAEADAAARSVVERLVERGLTADGQSPFNDQARVDLASGRRALVLAEDADSSDIVGAAVVGDGELEFLIAPERRGNGYGRAFATSLLDASGELDFGIDRAWAHGDHPAARRLAEQHDFARTRTLLQLRMHLGPAGAHRRAAVPSGVTVAPFVPGADDDEWVALNARVFSDHPEQGRLTVDDLRSRQREAWFDAGDFLIARDEDREMVAYNWLKVEGELGEIYVLGIDDRAAGRGLGRALMLAGLDRLRDRGCATAALYVDDENRRAVGLYRSLGFTDHAVDVQYTRRPR